MLDDITMTREQFIEAVLQAERVLVREWRDTHFDAEQAPGVCTQFAAAAHMAGDSTLELIFTALAFHIRHGFRLEFAVATIIQRLEDGHTFRAALLWSYKAHRRGLPPCY